MQQIADSGGGRYFRAAEPGAMADLSNEIQSFEDQSLQSEFNQRRVERFQLFLLVGALCLALAELLAGRFFPSTGGRRSPLVEGGRDA